MSPFRSRWWWSALLAGGSYCLPASGVLGSASTAQWNGWVVGSALIVAWKGAGVACLAAWLASRGERRLAAVLALGALGDVLLAMFGLVVGALAFAAGHLLAIHTYLGRARRAAQPDNAAKTAFSWRPFAVLVPFSLAVTHLLLQDLPLATVALVYAALVAGMAAAAWQSVYSRASTGLGALLFLVSDWLIFAGQGLPQAHDLARFGVWPLYFGGQALIAAGIVRGDATSPADPR